jgi:hypothetical protein
VRTAKPLLTALAVQIVLAWGPPAGADIGVCAQVKPPRNDAQALNRAGFAFDGTVVRGRAVRNPTTGHLRLVSPLTFRVIHFVKGSVADVGWRDASGRIFVTVWDATYVRPGHSGHLILKRRVLRGRGPDVVRRGELATVRGAVWRIYGLEEVGNWTSTGCLGSHRIEGLRQGTRSKAHSAERPIGRSRARPGLADPWVWVLVGLAGAGLVLVARSRIVKRHL